MALIVLAHGAWSSAWAWKKARPLMAAAGHQFVVPTYTGLGERYHLATPDIDLDTHIQDVMSVIEVDDLRDFVLIGHSYGGMVASGVADRMRDRVKHLIYLDAFVPDDGQSLSDLVPEPQRKRMRDGAKTNGGHVPSNPLPDDTPEADKAWILDRRCSQSLKCFVQPLTYRNGPLTVPRSYIQCMRYAEQGPFSQFPKRLRGQPGWKFYELDASHSPNVTAPQAVVDLFGKVIAAG